MQFNSWSEFFDMGGYSFFVWLSFGVTFLVMGLLIWHTYWTSSNLKKVARSNEKRQNRIRENHQHREAGPNMNEATK